MGANATLELSHWPWPTFRIDLQCRSTLKVDHGQHDSSELCPHPYIGVLVWQTQVSAAVPLPVPDPAPDEMLQAALHLVVGALLDALLDLLVVGPGGQNDGLRTKSGRQNYDSLLDGVVEVSGHRHRRCWCSRVQARRAHPFGLKRTSFLQ